jgi:mevalonate kinase
MTKEIYRSNGKILLTGEYLVLKGADAFVLPLNIGQSLEVSATEGREKNIIYWKALQNNQLWFNATINRMDLSIIQTTDQELAKKLIELLEAVRLFRPELFENKGSINFETDLGFDRNWGFGSSSTLISNLARWANIDPFLLFSKVSKGSGYDIAAATAEKPFIYSFKKDGKTILPVTFKPAYSENLYFVYLGNKQDSAMEVDVYLDRYNPVPGLITKVSELTHRILRCFQYKDFEKLILLHEQLLSNHLKRDTIQNLRFPDFQGAVKSLGAWGGDFALMTSEEGKDYLAEYLNDKRIDTFFSFDELVRQTHLSTKIPA